MKNVYLISLLILEITFSVFSQNNCDLIVYKVKFEFLSKTKSNVYLNYPQVILDDSVVENKINLSIQSNFDVNDAKDIYLQYCSDSVCECAVNVEYIQNGLILYKSKRILCISVLKSQMFCCAANGHGESYALNFDLTNGEELVVEDLFSESDFDTISGIILSSYVEQKYDSNKSWNKSNPLKAIDLLTAPFAISQFYISFFAVGLFSPNYTEVIKIPYEKIKEFIKPDSILNDLIK